jgi:hypothetical protein
MVANGFLGPEHMFFLDKAQFTLNKNANSQNNRQWSPTIPT